MLKVWVWRNRTDGTMARVSPVEPDKTVRDDKRDYYSHPLDLVVCSRYIRRITGKAVTLKPKLFYFTGVEQD